MSAPQLIDREVFLLTVRSPGRLGEIVSAAVCGLSFQERILFFTIEAAEKRAAELNARHAPEGAVYGVARFVPESGR